jgi:hypothetical protein
MIDRVDSATAPAATTKTSDDAVSKGFEKLLLQQLANEMLKTTGDDDSPYASLLPDALADAVEQGGGLGLDLGKGVS